MHLKVAGVPYPPYVIIYEDNGIKKLHGVIGSAFSNLTTSMNITFSDFFRHEVVFPTDGQYGDIAPDGSIHGSLMMINKELADVAIGPFNLEYIQWKVFPTANQLTYDNFQLISGMKDPFVSDAGAFINIFDKQSAELRLVLLIASRASRNAASEWRPRGRQSWIMFLISLTSLIVLSTAFYRIAGRQRKTSLFYDTSKYFYAYIEVLFFEATKVKFVPQANRILLAVWLIACLILINLFNGEVKANLLVKSDTERINTAEDVLRHPKLLPLTMKNSPLTTALQISSMESVRRLWDRMAAMGGAIPVPEVFTAKSLQLVQQRKAVIATDMMTGRVQSSLFCPVLDGFFYVGTQSITNLRSVWYYRKRIDPDVVREINKRILWLFESAVPFMRNEDLYPKGSTCFLDTSKQDRSGSFQPLTAQDMRAVFMLSGYLIAMACGFLLVELIVHGLSHCAGCLA